MSIKLIYITPLWLIANGIRYSHSNHHLSDSRTVFICDECYEQILDNINKELYCPNCGIKMTIDRNAEPTIGSKDFDLIKRIGFHQNHSSVLEHSLIIFHVEMSTKALLEESRHRIAVSQTVTSSRYALDLIDIKFENIPDPRKEEFAKKQQKELLEFIDSFRDERGKISKKDMDELAMLLPQNFIYKMQLTFNLRSLVHFLNLRLNKSAHYTIRNIAFKLLNSLPNDYKELILTNEKIRINYERIKNENAQ